MPKAEKQLRKDVTSLQQEVKRRRQNPGTPTDIGTWEGAESSQKRGPSHRAPQYVFNFLKGIAPSKIFGFGFTFLKGVALSVEHIRLLFNYETPQFLEQVFFPNRPQHAKERLSFLDQILFPLRPKFSQSLLFLSEIFKSMKRNLSNSLSLQDEITTQLNP